MHLNPTGSQCTINASTLSAVRHLSAADHQMAYLSFDKGVEQNVIIKVSYALRSKPNEALRGQKKRYALNAITRRVFHFHGLGSVDDLVNLFALNH